MSMHRNGLIHSQRRLTRRLAAYAIAACVGAPTPMSAEQRVIDTEHSMITVHVFKSGLFRAFADNHVIQAPVTDGSLDDGATPQVQLVVDAQRMRVLDPGLSPGDREQVQTRMLGPEVLDARRFPQIRFQSMTVERLSTNSWLVRGELTLHGQTHVLTVKVALEQGRYNGSTLFKQTDFGMRPISIAGGTVRVKDEVKIGFDIVAGPNPSAVR